MNDFLNDIRNGVDTLSRSKRLLFCAVTCEKLLPNYEAFTRLNQWGNPDVLRNALEDIYMYLTGKRTFNQAEILNLLHSIDRITPDTEDFSGILTSFALDACTSLEATLEFIRDDDSNHVVDVSSYAYDTVDMFVQEKEALDSNDRNIEEKISGDIFMKAEKSRQKLLLQQLHKIEDDSVSDDELKKYRDGQKIIDLSLLE